VDVKYTYWILIRRRMDLCKVFSEVVGIASPSGQEEKVREWLAGHFDSLRVKNEVVNNNLIVYLPGGEGKVMLVAHLDTVQKPGEIIKPRWVDGEVKSDGKTIVGADDKAGVAILLAVAKELGEVKDKPSVVLVFTSSEEVGEMSSAKMPIREINPDVIFNVDGCKPPGTVDVAALGQKVFEIRVAGKAAHAAYEPEKGKNAIVTAAKIIGGLPIGRDKRGNVLNIGSIEGGGATNVVPDRVVLRGEVRSFTNKGLMKMIAKIRKISRSEVVIDEKVGTPVWEEARAPKWTKIIKEAAETTGLSFKKDKMYACSDANYLAQSGIPTFSLNRGGKNPHSVEEAITLQEMEETKRFIIEILKLCL
jgi:tripeptide aminopeptidase